MKYDLDLCDAISGRPTTNIMKIMVANFYEKHISKQKCPFRGVFNVTMNPDNSTRTLALARIPRLPQGDYKTEERLHTAANETISSFELKFTIKSKTGVNRTTMLDMG